MPKNAPARTFTPTANQLTATLAYLAAKAVEEHLRPIVEGYQREILANHQFHLNPEYVSETNPDHVILDPKWSWMLGDADFTVYNSECKARRDALGLYVDDHDKCPLLVAHHHRIAGEHAVLESMSEIPALADKGDFTVLQGEDRATAIQLTVGLIAPFLPTEK